jgi:hypothetical protein
VATSFGLDAAQAAFMQLLWWLLIMKWKAILQDGFFYVIRPRTEIHSIPRLRGKEVHVTKTNDMPDQRWSGI